MIKGEKLKKYLPVILVIGLILVIAWKLNLFGFLTWQAEKTKIMENREAWMESAKENLKEDFLFMEGVNRLFVKGRLTSECTERDPNSHCPLSVFKAKINNHNLFIDKDRFAIQNEDPDIFIFPNPVNEGISVLGFLDKDRNESANLEFEILEYIPNTELCAEPHGHYENKFLCSLRWNKKIFLKESIPVETLLVEITDFDYSVLDQEVKIFLKGEIENNKKPNTSLALYANYKSKKSLKKESYPETLNQKGTYAFELDESFNVPHHVQNYSILFLVTGENAFYAKEWIFENGGLVNTVIYN